MSTWQVHAMRDATPFRELAPSKVIELQETYMAKRDDMASNLFHHHIVQIAAPLADAWTGLGHIPNSTDMRMPPPPFAAYLMDSREWQLRTDMAAMCRLLARLNGFPTWEGSFAHFSIAIGDGTYLLVPPSMPFAAVRASMLLLVDAEGRVIRGSAHGLLNVSSFQMFNRARHVDGDDYPAILFTHTTFTDKLAHASKRLRYIHQSAFNFADDHFGYFDAWHDPKADIDESLLSFLAEKVFVMLSHGGCIVRGVDTAHVFALVHGFDAAAQIQLYAEATGMPLLEIPVEEVRTFPRHGYGQMSVKSKRMELYFAANKRLLLSNWNQGFRDTGDRAFAL
jgi:ribulose-5-phosphate 4-epimerase/fuculose-1-phosphate aldolase